MRITYCQRLLFPNTSAHAIHSALTAFAFAKSGAEVELFPGAPFRQRQRIVQNFFLGLGLEPLPPSLSISVLATRHKGLYGLLFRLALWRSMKKPSPSLCWASSVKEADMALSLRPTGNTTPVVFEVHHLISQLKKGQEAERLFALEKRVFEEADMIVFNCEALRRAASGYLPEPRKSLVSPIGYNEHIIHAVRDPEQAEPAETSGTVRLVYVGSLQKGKGVEQLIQSLTLLPAKYQLSIIGGGKPEWVETLQAQVHETGMADRVQFMGRVEQRQLTSLLQPFDIFIIPTNTEKDFFAPIKMFEALGFGIPVVATPTPSLQDGLIDGENAVFSADASPAALAQAIVRLGEDPDLRKAIRRANLQRAKGLTTAARANALMRTFADEFALEKE